MTEYTGIQGQNILIVSSDPANPTEGQIWYNSTTNLLKGYANVVTNAWASGGNLNTARRFISGAGTQTSALGFGGFSGTTLTSSESYNGTSWTNTPSLNTARFGAGGSGSTNTAALCVGGATPTRIADVESYNGSWTSVSSLPAVKGYLAAAGTQTSTIAFGGENNTGTYLTTSDLWGGSSWTAGPNMNTGRSSLAGSGIQTSALAFGGDTAGTPSSNTAATESYNGTSWTTVNSLNTSRLSLAGAGSQTATVAFGGAPASFSPFLSATELWNGTSWTSNPSGLATARGGLAGSGIQTAALAFGGFTSFPTNVANTEQWTGTAVAVTTITTS